MTSHATNRVVQANLKQWKSLYTFQYSKAIKHLSSKHGNEGWMYSTLSLSKADQQNFSSRSPLYVCQKARKETTQTIRRTV